MTIRRNLELEIENLLGGSMHPLSLRQISLQLNHAWHTINSRCEKLESKGRVEHMRVGKAKLWRLKQ